MIFSRNLGHRRDKGGCEQNSTGTAMRSNWPSFAIDRDLLPNQRDSRSCRDFKTQFEPNLAEKSGGSRI